MRTISSDEEKVTEETPRIHIKKDPETGEPIMLVYPMEEEDHEEE